MYQYQHGTLPVLALNGMKARENDGSIMISHVEYPISASALVLQQMCFAVVHFFCCCAFVLQLYNFFAVLK